MSVVAPLPIIYLHVRLLWGAADVVRGCSSAEVSPHVHSFVPTGATTPQTAQHRQQSCCLVNVHTKASC
jgi:hypothetical protein